MEFSSLPEFDKQLKTLLRKYRTLEKDLDLLKTVLEKHPRGYPPGIVRVSRLGINTEIYKVKHFRCKSLKHKGSRSGIRIVYAFFAEEEKIEFVEIYYKEKDNIECDKSRILKYYS
jgi:mRNA-degrading endonuclease RelE of RelBE toxin-antitoxin system